MTGIYKFTNRYNRKCYIGQAVNIKQRYNQHKSNAANGVKTYFYNAIRKYGFNSFDFTILIECPKENLNYWEKFYIRYYCSTNKDLGYNIANGGKGSSSWTEEMKKKQSDKQIERFKSKEAREVCSKAAINRYKKPGEREKVRNEQLKRLENIEYKNFLKELCFKAVKKRKEILENDIDKYNSMCSKISNKRKDYFKNISKEDYNNWKEKLRESQIKRFEDPEQRYKCGGNRGKHKVWDDETHTKYHYE